MGGAVAVGGNMTAAAEFNAWMDPTAADDVLASEVNVKMIPLDVTERFEWSAGEIRALRGAGRVGKLLADAIHYIEDRDGMFVPHDAVAAIALTSPELFGWRPRQVRCETKASLRLVRQWSTGDHGGVRDTSSWPRTLKFRRYPPAFSARSRRLRSGALRRQLSCRFCGNTSGRAPDAASSPPWNRVQHHWATGEAGVPLTTVQREINRFSEQIRSAPVVWVVGPPEDRPHQWGVHHLNQSRRVQMAVRLISLPSSTSKPGTS